MNKSLDEFSRNNEEKNENNFYDVCIQAIELNNDDILNKKECINQINKLKFDYYMKKNLSALQPKKKIDKKEKKKTTKKPIKQKCIDEILDESNKEFLNLNIIKKSIEKNNSSKDINKDINSSLEKEKKINLNRFFKGKQRRYTILKHINEYLESNDVTMNELIDNNPFQDKPYCYSGSYEFIEAVKFGNYDYVKKVLLADGIYLFVIDYYGQTGYHWAAKLGNIKMLDLLITFGRHHNQKDFKGRTPLYLAAVNNNIEVCKFLLSNGANPFLYDKFRKTPADVAGSKKLRDLLRNNMEQPFSNPVYKAKNQKILQGRVLNLFKINKKDNEDEKVLKPGPRLSKQII